MSDSVIPRTAACQALLSFSISQSLLKFMTLSQWCYLSISSFAAPFSYIPFPINWTLWLNENWPESSFYLKSFCRYLQELPTFLCKLIIVIIVISFTPRYHFHFKHFQAIFFLNVGTVFFWVCFSLHQSAAWHRPGTCRKNIRPRYVKVEGCLVMVLPSYVTLGVRLLPMPFSTEN